MHTFKKQAEAAVREIDLNEKDLERERQVRVEIEQWHHALYGAVDEQLHEHGKDAARVEQLTTGLTVRYAELRELDEKRMRVMGERQRVKNLLKLLGNDPGNPSGTFPHALYEALVDKVTVYPDGAIHYHLAFGIEWSTPKRYQDYLAASRERVNDNYKRKHEQLLQDPAIGDMLTYCEQPRTRKELLGFLAKRLPVSKH